MDGTAQYQKWLTFSIVMFHLFIDFWAAAVLAFFQSSTTF